MDQEEYMEQIYTDIIEIMEEEDTGEDGFFK